MALPTLPHTPASLTMLVSVAAARLSRPAANLAAAHWAVETAGGASMYGWNPGNLTCGAAPKAACGLNPLVTSPNLQFAMFGDLVDGADAYFTFIKAHGGYDELAAADLTAFSSALSAIGYAGPMPASTYASQLQAWLPKTQAIVLPPPATIGGFTVGNLALIASVGVAGLFFGTWAADGFKRPKIPSAWGLS